MADKELIITVKKPHFFLEMQHWKGKKCYTRVEKSSGPSFSVSVSALKGHEKPMAIHWNMIECITYFKLTFSILALASIVFTQDHDRPYACLRQIGEFHHQVCLSMKVPAAL